MKSAWPLGLFLLEPTDVPLSGVSKGHEVAG